MLHAVWTGKTEVAAESILRNHHLPRPMGVGVDNRYTIPKKDVYMFYKIPVK